MKKSLADWASIAEILGAAAIVVSLAFVGLEIRANTRATQAATLQQSLGYEISILIGVVSHDLPTFTEYSRLSFGLPSGDPASDDLAVVRANNYYFSALRLFEDLYLQREAGTLSDDAWDSRQGIIRGFANGPGIELYLDSDSLSAGFRDYLRALRED
jgi:hypothetical protein